MGTWLQAEASGARYSSRQEMASWPSVKMSASTTTRSPMTRLMGNRPPSISGSTPSMTTLCLPASSLIPKIPRVRHAGLLPPPPERGAPRHWFTRLWGGGAKQGRQRLESLPLLHLRSRRRIRDEHRENNSGWRPLHRGPARRQAGHRRQRPGTPVRRLLPLTRGAGSGAALANLERLLSDVALPGRRVLLAALPGSEFGFLYQQRLPVRPAGRRRWWHRRRLPAAGNLQGRLRLCLPRRSHRDLRQQQLRLLSWTRE